MNEKNTNERENKCYVFSETTLEHAVEEWLEFMNKKSPTKKESFLIFSVALPWFLEHFKQTGSISMFTHNDLVDGIKKWRSSQIVAFPNREERIDETCSLLIDFFESEVVLEHKMLIQA